MDVCGRCSSSNSSSSAERRNARTCTETFQSCQYFRSYNRRCSWSCGRCAHVASGVALLRCVKGDETVRTKKGLWSNTSLDYINKNVCMYTTPVIASLASLCLTRSISGNGGVAHSSNTHAGCVFSACFITRRPGYMYQTERRCFH